MSGTERSSRVVRRIVAVWAMVAISFAACDRKNASTDPAAQTKAADAAENVRIVESKSTISPGFERLLGTGDTKKPVEINTLSLSDDGTRLALGSAYANGKGVQIWDLSSPSPTKTQEIEAEGAVLSGDGKQVAYYSDFMRKFVGVTDVGGKSHFQARFDNGSNVNLAFGPSGDLIVTMVMSAVDQQHVTRLVCWDIAKGVEKYSVKLGEAEPPVTCSNLFAKGTSLATGHWNKPPAIKFWDLPAGKISRSLVMPGQDDSRAYVLVSEDGKIMACKLSFGDLVVLKLPENEVICTVPESLISRGSHDCFCLDAGNDTVFYCGRTASLHGATPGANEFLAVRISTGKAYAVLKGHAKEITKIALSRNGKVLAAASQDGSIKLWDFDQQK